MQMVLSGLLNRRTIGACFALLLSAIVIQSTGASLTWVVLLLAFLMALLGSVVLAYSGVELSFLFLCALAFCLPFEISKALVFEAFGDTAIEYLTIADFLGFFTVFSFFVERIRSKKEGLYLNRLFAPAMALFFWSLLTAFRAPKPYDALSYLLGYTKWFILAFAASNILNSSKRIKIFLTAFAASIVIEGLLAFLQMKFHLLMNIQGQKSTLVGRYLYFGGSMAELLRPAGTFHHPSAMASFMAVMAPIFISLLLLNAKDRFRPALIAGAFFGVVALVLSYARAGWLSFGVALVLILLIAQSRQMLSKKQWSGLIALFFIAALMLLPFAPKVIDRLTKPDDQASKSRVILLKQAWMMAEDHPWMGVGIGNYIEAGKQYFPPGGYELMALSRGIAVVHNKFACVLAETGFVGLALFLFLLFQIFKTAFRNLKSKDSFLKYLSLGLLGAFTANTGSMFFDPHIDGGRNVLFWLITALIMAISILNEKGNRVER